MESQPVPPDRGIKAQEISRDREEAQPAGKDGPGLRNPVLTLELQLV
jgi:hypothetical protein